MQTKSGKQLSKIGIGTFGVGGRGHRDVVLTEVQADEVYVNALVYSLNRGSNFTEISLGYGHGHSLELFKHAIDKSELDREDVFITHSLYPRDLVSLATMLQDTNDFYRIMKTDYADSTLVTQSLILKFGESQVFKWLYALLNAGHTRYVSLSNASPSWINKFKQEFDDKFFAHEGHLSFEVRVLQDKDVMKTCDALGVANIIWRPLRRNATLQQNWKLLSELADKYEKSQSQIILNWMCSLGYMPMVFSTNNAHIDENLASLDFSIEPADLERLTSFRLNTNNLPPIDWEGENIDDDIVNLAKTIENYVIE